MWHIWCMEGKYHQQMSKNVTNPFWIQVLWNVMLYGSQNFKNFRKMASIWLIFNTRNHTPIIQHHIPEDINPLQHHCKTCKYCNACYKSLSFALNTFTNTRTRKKSSIGASEVSKHWQHSKIYVRRTQNSYVPDKFSRQVNYVTKILFMHQCTAQGQEECGWVQRCIKPHSKEI